MHDVDCVVVPEKVDALLQDLKISNLYRTICLKYTKDSTLNLSPLTSSHLLWSSSLKICSVDFTISL